MSDVKSALLGEKHIDTNVEKVLEQLADPRAFWDRDKNIRKVPIFSYDSDGNPIRVTHWQERPTAPQGMERDEAEAKGLDFYNERRGWIRLGKKAERDFS